MDAAACGDESGAGGSNAAEEGSELDRAASGSAAAVGSASGTGSELDRLAGIMRRLRAECAWNAQQSHRSLSKYSVEEAHELVDAIEQGDDAALMEELGDVLYQVYFHAEIARSQHRFDIQDVAAAAARKMIARHPHVFAGIRAETPEEVVRVWDEVKAREKASRSSVLDGVPMAMPALALAEKLLSRAAQTGMTASAALDALDAPEAPDALNASDAAVSAAPADEAELGRRLLALVAQGRAAGLEAERALRGQLQDLAERIREHEAGSS